MAQVKTVAVILCDLQRPGSKKDIGNQRRERERKEATRVESNKGQQGRDRARHQRRRRTLHVPRTSTEVRGKVTGDDVPALCRRSAVTRPGLDARKGPSPCGTLTNAYFYLRTYRGIPMIVPAFVSFGFDHSSGSDRVLLLEDPLQQLTKIYEYRPVRA